MDEFRLNTFFTVVVLMILIVLHNYNPVGTKLGISGVSIFYLIYACHIESLMDVGYFDAES